MNSTEHKPLIAVSQVKIGPEPVRAVEGRDLHAALGVKKRFTDWAKQQIARLRLLSDRDYLAEVYPLQGINSGQGRPEARYWFALDAAKHIAMMANTERGFEVREYFIECERRLTGIAPTPRFAVSDPTRETISQDPAFAAWLGLPAEERRVRQRDVTIYKQMGGVPLMRWAAWNVGLPIPPRHLLGLREQFEMDLNRRHASPGSVLISINGNGEAH